MGERRESRESEAAPQLVSAKAAGAADSSGTSLVGAETAGRSAKIVYPRQLHAFEREPKNGWRQCNFCGNGTLSGRNAI